MSTDLGALVRRFGAAARERCGGWLPDHVEKALRAISLCRTAELGGHVYVCQECGVTQPRYNSCRNRHCPQCQGLARLEWLAKRLEDVLPVPYYHVVFTVPHELQPLTRLEPRAFYSLLFRTAWESLRDLAADPKYLGGQVGMLAVLHTWGQQLQPHPHVHGVVPGCFLTPEGEWRRCNKKFLVPVEALSLGFRGRFVAALERAVTRGKLKLPKDLSESPSRYLVWLRELETKRWNIFIKPPFAGPEHVLRYLARYTHRVAISNARLLELDGDQVVYRYKQYRKNGRWCTGRMHGVELVRRFTQHILPPGFVRIRYYGLLSNRRRRETVKACRATWGEPSVDTDLVVTLVPEVADSDQPTAPCATCGAKSLRLLETVPASPGLRPRAPP